MAPRKLLGASCLVTGFLLAACSGEPADLPSTETTPASAATSTSSASGLASTSTSISFSTSTSTSTSIAPTSTTSLVASAQIVIEGDDKFVDHANASLDLLRRKAPTWYDQVGTYVDTIRLVPRGSGMDVFTLTFLAGEQTAYAPGYEEPDQRVWFASALTHDACHSRLYATGEAYTGRDAELECLMDQLAALKLLDDVGFMTGYVQGLIDGVDDPDNDYWNDPDRHW